MVVSMRENNLGNSSKFLLPSLSRYLFRGTEFKTRVLCPFDTALKVARFYSGVFISSVFLFVTGRYSLPVVKFI